jgi:hypothetical protein
MWDADDEYRHPKFHGRSIIVPQPTVNILACTQPEMLYKAFPPEAIGQGVCSRFILIFAEPTGIRITWPQKPSKEVGQALVTRLEEMKRRVRGEITLSQGASAVFDTIYQDYQGIRDPRFKHYNGRRFTHLIKLSMVIAAMDLRTEIDAVDVVRANTMLHVAEMRMPNALGEFGEGKNSSLGSKIIALLVQEGKPMTSKRIFQDLANDIHNEQQLLDTLKHLSVAEKIRTLKSPEGKIGYVPNKVMPQEWKKDLIDLSFLSPEEIM